MAESRVVEFAYYESDAFRSASTATKAVYACLLASRKLSRVGVLTMTPRGFAHVHGLDAGEVADAVVELHDLGLVFYDPQTDEVHEPTRLEHDLPTSWTHVVNVWNHFDAVASEPIRARILAMLPAVCWEQPPENTMGYGKVHPSAPKPNSPKGSEGASDTPSDTPSKGASEGQSCVDPDPDPAPAPASDPPPLDDALLGEAVLIASKRRGIEEQSKEPGIKFPDLFIKKRRKELRDELLAHPGLERLVGESPDAEALADLVAPVAAKVKRHPTDCRCNGTGWIEVEGSKIDAVAACPGGPTEAIETDFAAGAEFLANRRGRHGT